MKETKPKSVKRICQYCQNNEYSESFSRHLQGKHKDIWGKRQLIKEVIKGFGNEELEEVKQLVLSIKQKKQR